MSPKRKASSVKKQPIPEDFELSDEPATVNLNKEQELTSKHILLFDCPICGGKLQMRNEIEVNSKGIKCKCSPCSFKVSKNDKAMNVKKDDDGEIVKKVKTIL